MIITEWVNDLNWITSDYMLLIFVFFIYMLYVRKFKHYKYLPQVDKDYKSLRPRGKCPPFYPNGWYKLLNSDELGVNAVKHLDYCGRDIVLFRGTNHKVYALDAFCAHMGANMGIGGKVKLNQCIQCPFHGWLFDGETGHSINANVLHKKETSQYEYFNVKKQENVNGDYLKKCYDGNATQKKYIVKEVSGSVLIWYDSRPEFHDKVLYEPLVIDQTGMELRGTSNNYVKSHIQDIPENGADGRHFDYIHAGLSKWLPFVKVCWSLKCERAVNPDLFEIMRHEDKFFTDFKMSLLNKYLTEENKKYANVIDLNNHVLLFGKFKVFLFNATIIQLGPALVYICLKSKYWQLNAFETVTPLAPYYQRLSVRLHASWFMPYFLSAWILYGVVTQLIHDQVIWDYKMFGASLAYNLKTDADNKMLKWKNWYATFYEGCYEFEKKKKELEW